MFRDDAPTGAADRAAHLDRAWDAFLTGVGQSNDLDPAHAALIRRLGAFADDPVPGPARERVRRRVVGLADRAIDDEGRTMVARQDVAGVRAALGPPAHHSDHRRGVDRGMASASRLRRPVRVAAEGLTAAVLVLALVGGLAALTGRYGALDRLAGPGALIDRQEANPWRGGGEFSGAGGLLELPPAPVAARLLRVDFGPGGRLDVPDGVSVSLESRAGGVTVDLGAVGNYTLDDRSFTDFIGPASVRNDGATPVSAVLAVFSTAGEGLAPAGEITVAEVGGGVVDRLPGERAFLLHGQGVLGRGVELQASRELTDTGRSGFSIVWVEAGEVRLTHQSGIMRLRKADGSAGRTLAGPGNEEVPLGPGDSAFITEGAAFEVTNGGDAEARVTIVSVVNPERLTDADLWAALQGTPEAGAAIVIDDATPTAPAVFGEEIDPTACRTEPRTVADVEALLAMPVSAEADIAVDEEMQIERADQLPQGAAADAERVLAVTELERQFVACWNAGDVARVLGLFSDELARELAISLVEDGGRSVAVLLVEPAGPLPEADRITLFPVRGVRVLPDGRIGAIVEWGATAEPGMAMEANFHIYRQVDGRWVIDEEIGSFVPGL